MAQRFKTIEFDIVFDDEKSTVQQIAEALEKAVSQLDLTALGSPEVHGFIVCEQEDEEDEDVLPRLGEMTPVNAEVHSDDSMAQGIFDASPWFRQATDDKILALAKEGWRGSYEADEVAESVRGVEDHVSRVLDYVDSCREAGKEMGFEVVVNETDAKEWVRKNRPHLHPWVA